MNNKTFYIIGLIVVTLVMGVITSCANSKETTQEEWEKILIEVEVSFEDTTETLAVFFEGDDFNDLDKQIQEFLLNNDLPKIVDIEIFELYVPEYDVEVIGLPRYINSLQTLELL